MERYEYKEHYQREQCNVENSSEHMYRLFSLFSGINGGIFSYMLGDFMEKFKANDNKNEEHD